MDQEKNLKIITSHELLEMLPFGKTKFSNNNDKDQKKQPGNPNERNRTFAFERT